jgi:hypothetical protein
MVFRSPLQSLPFKVALRAEGYKSWPRCLRRKEGSCGSDCKME